MKHLLLPDVIQPITEPRRTTTGRIPNWSDIPDAMEAAKRQLWRLAAKYSRGIRLRGLSGSTFSPTPPPRALRNQTALLVTTTAVRTIWNAAASDLLSKRAGYGNHCIAIARPRSQRDRVVQYLISLRAASSTHPS